MVLDGSEPDWTKDIIEITPLCIHSTLGLDVSGIGADGMAWKVDVYHLCKIGTVGLSCHTVNKHLHTFKPSIESQYVVLFRQSMPRKCGHALPLYSGEHFKNRSSSATLHDLNRIKFPQLLLGVSHVITLSSQGFLKLL